MKIKTCQRCSNNFECRQEDIANCGCSVIQLSKETNVYLAKTNYDCLCLNCLQMINQMQAAIKEESSTAQTKNKHYYVENDLLVFTEYALMKRGACCKSNCRHCAYGFKFA